MATETTDQAWWSRPTQVLRAAGFFVGEAARSIPVTRIYLSLVFSGRYAWSAKIEKGLLRFTGDPELVAEIKAAQYAERRDHLLREIGNLAESGVTT